MKDQLKVNQISTTSFVHHCAEKFRWGDLSKDVFMDVGCRGEVYCGKSILAEFPKVNRIIAIDKEQIIIEKSKSNTSTRIECVVADIEKRQTLQQFEARVTKVLSVYYFHLVLNIEEAFQNVYNLLKPGGEAAFLFTIESFLYEWLMKMSKWKCYALQAYNIVDSYKNKSGSFYREIVEKIGFQVLECAEVKMVTTFPSDATCEEGLYQMTKSTFKVPLEYQKAFKEDSFKEFIKLNGKDLKGKPFYRCTDLHLLLIKPPDAIHPKI